MLEWLDIIRRSPLFQLIFELLLGGGWSFHFVILSSQLLGPKKIQESIEAVVILE